MKPDRLAAMEKACHLSVLTVSHCCKRYKLDTFSGKPRPAKGVCLNEQVLKPIRAVSHRFGSQRLNLNEREQVHYVK
jgi:hypothetical protein